MRNLIPAWLRVTAIFLVIIGLTEYFIDSGKNLAIIENPILQVVLLVALLFLISAEVIVSAIENTMFKTLSEEAKENYMRAEQAKAEKYNLKKIMRKWSGTRPLSEERDLELDHNYDGIKELDNTLPPWWLYSFYATIIFAGAYMAWYHVFDGITQEQEYQMEMAEANIQIEEYKKTAPDLIDANTVELLT
ncbi:cbb3-type cytochrome c oxidase N-terminal domain-containing protein [Antarcticibacterium sp. 1MA-6-2]|uniref:cbb3-type cytochrome c oxidase N-terminal domain-containing protein n=1 Tax=Antarcticibacterium sp. 1MA-6-2 TaxID=2908210 RepID=UPI0028832714|nr:cbb3-type cytochrome c oxidase N-terminal domain-containing protein [Antarcticibacterium sp. 1MA-6-2]